MTLLQKVVEMMEEKSRLRPILIKIALNFGALLIVLMLHNRTATSAHQIEASADFATITSLKIPRQPLADRFPQIQEVTEEEKQAEEKIVEIPHEDKLEYVEEEWPERVVFLTFDDGPSWNTDRLLDILYKENAPSTFFVLGHSMLMHDAANTQTWLERILEEGHYVGLHSMSHDPGILYSGYGAAGRFVDEMQQLQELIYEMTGHHTDLCRAPFGMMTNFTPYSGHAEAIEAAGIQCIDWNIDPQDWTNSADLVIHYVISQVEMLNFPSELVIVLHEENATVEALPAIIAFLREHGYVFKAYQPGHEFIYQQYRYLFH